MITKSELDSFDLADELLSEDKVIIINTMPAEIFRTKRTDEQRWFRKQYSQLSLSKDLAARYCLSVVNSMVHHDKTIFGLNRDAVEAIVKGDVNWGDTCQAFDTKKYRAVLAKLISKKYIEVLIEGKAPNNKEDGKVTIVKLIHPLLRKMMKIEITDAFEAQGLAAAQAFHDRMPSENKMKTHSKKETATKEKPNTKTENVQQESEQDPVKPSFQEETPKAAPVKSAADDFAAQAAMLRKKAEKQKEAEEAELLQKEQNQKNREDLNSLLDQEPKEDFYFYSDPTPDINSSDWLELLKNLKPSGNVGKMKEVDQEEDVQEDDTFDA